jgi:hypothetical protein
MPPSIIMMKPYEKSSGRISTVANRFLIPDFSTTQISHLAWVTSPPSQLFLWVPTPPSPSFPIPPPSVPLPPPLPFGFGTRPENLGFFFSFFPFFLIYIFFHLLGPFRVRLYLSFPGTSHPQIFILGDLSSSY